MNTIARTSDIPAAAIPIVRMESGLLYLETLETNDSGDRKAKTPLTPRINRKRIGNADFVLLIGISILLVMDLSLNAIYFLLEVVFLGQNRNTI